MQQNYTHLKDVDNPQIRSKLEGFQEASYAIDENILKTKKEIEQKRGVVHAAGLISARVTGLREPIQSAVDADKMDPDEAKIRIDQINKAIALINNIGQSNTNDLITMQGVIQGLERAQQITAHKFQETVDKHERWKRIEAEEQAELEDLNMAEEESEPEEQPKEQEDETTPAAPDEDEQDATEDEQESKTSGEPAPKARTPSKSVKKAIKNIKAKKQK